MLDQNDFFRWEVESRDVIDFKRIYADMAGGEALLGLVLSEIVFWHLPSKDGESKLRAFQEGEYWVVRARHEWWDRIRISPKQADRALAELESMGLIIKKLFKWNGAPTVHIRINWPTFLTRLHEASENPPSNPYKPDDEGEGQGVKSISTKGENPFLPKGEMDFDERGKSLTEITVRDYPTETTHTDLSIAADAARPPAAGDLKKKPSSGGRNDRDQFTKGIPEGAEDTSIEPPTALGKFIVGVNGKTTKMTLVQIDQIDRFYDVYVDGEVKKVNPSTLYDEDPYFREYCKKIAADLKRQQQSGKRQLPPSRDRMIKFLTTNKRTGLDVFFRWREDRISRERADAYSQVSYGGDVYVDSEKAAFEAEIQAILRGEHDDESNDETDQ